MTNLRRSTTRRLAMLALLTALPVATAFASAKVSIMPPEIDFGRLEQNEARSANLVVRNEGDLVLDIINVESTCGCTVAKPLRDSLQPGESTTIEVTFNSKDFQGPQHKIITVQTNDPIRTMIEIPVLADVHAPLIVQPADKAAAFGRVPQGQGGEQVVEFSAPDQQTLTIETIKTRPDLFTIELSPGAAPNSRRATLRLRKDAPPGPFRELVIFHTNVPQRSQVDISVSGTVLAPVVLLPEEVNFRYAPPNAKMTRKFVLRPQTGTVVNVKQATIDLPGFKVTSVTRNAESGETVIEVEGLPLAAGDPAAIAAQGRFSGTLRVLTDAKAAPELKAAVKYMLKM
ncbi:MAG: DUF1573 domain-containing protein [bacterium]|nr:DUF1573 domain-containing protein [bacterium]